VGGNGASNAGAIAASTGGRNASQAEGSTTGAPSPETIGLSGAQDNAQVLGTTVVMPDIYD
jgi:hypothetical protein